MCLLVPAEGHSGPELKVLDSAFFFRLDASTCGIVPFGPTIAQPLMTRMSHLMKQSKVTIRMNGGSNEVVVDGRTFDRSQMDREQRGQFRRLIVQAFRNEQQGGGQ
jgi:hypothetical protein